MADLSVLNGDNLPVYWLGAGVGNFAFPFERIRDVVNYRDYALIWVNSQIMDLRTGTHISPPAHYGLPPGFGIDDEMRPRSRPGRESSREVRRYQEHRRHLGQGAGGADDGAGTGDLYVRVPGRYHGRGLMARLARDHGAARAGA